MSAFTAHKYGFVFSAGCDKFFCFFFWFVTHISQEQLNGFAPNSQGRRIWSLAGKNLNVKVKGQGHRDKNALSTPITPLQRRNGTCLLPMTSRSDRRHHSVAAGDNFGGLACGVCLVSLKL